MNTPYLIQRLIRTKLTGPLQQYRFGEVFKLDYMGNAEFEFGAFPDFMRRMNGAELISFKLEINGRKVFGVADSSAYENQDVIKEVLQNIADQKYRLKCSSYFPPEEPWQEKVNAWADIGNGMFWSFENINSTVLTLFKNSVEYMNSQKKEN